MTQQRAGLATQLRRTDQVVGADKGRGEGHQAVVGHAR